MIRMLFFTFFRTLMSLFDFIGRQIENFGINDTVEGLQDFLQEQGHALVRGSEVVLRELSDAWSACQLELRAVQEGFVREAKTLIRTIKRQLMLLRMEINMPKNDILNFLGLNG